MTTTKNITVCFRSFYKTLFFIRVPPLEIGNVNEFKGGTLMKKVFSGAKETHLDILRGGQRNSYQLENAVKSGGTVFCIYHLG